MRKLSTSVPKTHQVINQARPFFNVDLLQSDPGLKRGLKAFGVHNDDMKIVHDFGKLCTSEENLELAKLAEKNRPTLRQFDNYGRRIDVADYHPAYHQLMKFSLSHGCHSFGYNNPHHGSFITRGALSYFAGQLEPGHGCPVTMTSAAVPILREHSYTAEWGNKACAQDYDPRNVPITEKHAVTIGMSMTEKQGGSDVRSNTTMAVPASAGVSGPGQAYFLTGHKWFTSAPMCDGFLTLAKVGSVSSTPSCFLVPRWLPDGTRNEGFQVMRLKDKLADRANGSSEVEYNNAWGMMVGAEGKGVKTIIEMVQCTRLDCTLGSAASARRALMMAINHTSTRRAFGATLVDQPLMTSVLSELCAESEAHTLTALRLSAAFDKMERGDEAEANLFRIAVAVSKYFITKRTPHFVYECMEAHGGNGFVEDYPLAMLYRHAPLNSIWEGSGNVMVLDILRAGKAIPVLLNEIAKCKGMDSTVDAVLQELTTTVDDMLKGDLLSLDNQRRARNLADRLAMAFEASLLLRYGNPLSARLYITSRFGDSANTPRGANYGSSYNALSHEEARGLIEENQPVFY